MFIIIAIIAASAITVMVGSHLFLYRTSVRFFNIQNAFLKKITFWLFIILSLSFILAFALVARYDNIFTHYLYILAVSWMGIMVNLLMATGIGWLIYFVAKYFKVNIKMNYVALALIATVFAIFGYGYWNAQNVQLKFITVKIANLPPEWQGKTAVQITDVHAGIINNEKFLNRLTDQLSHIRKDIVFITGDYFDSRDGSMDKMAAPLKNIKAEQGVYFITGNHEKYINENQALTALSNANVKILKNEIINIDGLNIAGIDFPGDMQTSASSTDMLEQIKPEEPTILLYHEPKLIAEAKKAGVDLQLAGHTHAGQIWPLNFFTKLIYGKYYYGLHQEENYTIYTSSGVGTWGPPIRTGNTPEIVVITLEQK